MKHIFIDFEMQPIPKRLTEKRRICRNEIIEIGAVVLDDTMSEVDSYKAFVRPAYSDAISKWVTDLTGITDQQVNAASPFEVAMKDLAEWCMGLGDDIIVYAWSGSDLEQVQKESELKGYIADENLQAMFSCWKDYQKIFGELVEAKDPVALEKALSLIGIQFTGSKHDALWDARNTAELFKAAQDEEELKAIVDSMKTWAGEKEGSTNTMGDLIDFSAILAAIA